jgi:menaquinone-dependent protoporphyrinogen oxidase
LKSLILYTSSHGTTAKAALLLQENLKGGADVINIKKKPNLDITDYDLIVIGSSIHIGSIPKRMKNFMQENLDILKSKKLGLFLCCMKEDDEAREQFETAFSKELREASISNGLFGGEFLLDKMNFIQRAMVKKVSGKTSSVFNLNDKAISKFAKEISAAL